jgi:HD-GYP domain-containing protein (c-di-GMP phosphodiesterase class II)
MLEDPQHGRFLRGESVMASTVLSMAQPMVLEDSQITLSPADHDGGMRICQPLVVKGRTIGLLNIVRRANAGSVGDGAMRTIGMIAQQAAFAIDNARLYKDLQTTYIETVTALANAIEIRDPYTHGHTDRVKVLARAIGAKLGWDDERLANLWMGCTLHDIGKIGVPDSVLSKPGPLTADEFAVMKTHPEIGAKIIEGVPFLKAAVPYVYYHHERYNGTGYPTGAAGEEIPIEGRLLAVVDAFDAITSDRPYRRSQSIAAAREELRIFSGIQFDPLILDVFFQVLDSSDFPWIVSQRHREAEIPIPVTL